MFRDSSEGNGDDKRGEHGRDAQADKHIRQIIRAKASEDDGLDASAAKGSTQSRDEHDANHESGHASFTRFDGEKIHKMMNEEG